MTYTFKLSKRLAQCYGAVCALLALMACEASRTTSVVVPSIAQMDVTPDSIDVDPGQSQLFQAIGRDAAGNPVPTSVTWAVTTGTITATGNYTADTSLADAVITATLQGGGLTATARVRKRRVVQVLVMPGNATVVSGASQAFLARGVRNTGDTVAINAAFSATGGAISSQGLYTAGVTAGTYSVIALDPRTSLADTAAVIVTAAPPPPPPPAPVASVTVSPATANVAVDGTVQLTAVTHDAAGAVLSGRTIVWSSANSAVATVSPSGLVTGVAQSGGTTAVLATSEGQTDTATITVTAVSSGSCIPTGSGVCRYVDAVAGNDANPGTGSQPYRTLQKAGSVVNPGDVVVVRNGIYTGGSTILSLSRSGTAAAWIVVRAETKWGAVIDGQNNASGTGIQISGSYIRVEGFEIFGTNHYGIEVYGGQDVQVARTHIHDVGRYCTSTSNGIVGINAYAANLLIEQNVVHDIGRLAHGEAGCTTTNNYWQNHDHGVYQGQGDNLIIRNNVFYNFTRGWAIQRYSGAGTAVTDLQIVNNTFVGANPYKDGQIIIASPVTGLVITNNIFMQPQTAGVWLSSAGVIGTMANNLVFGANLTTGSTVGLVVAGTLTGDPQFVNGAGRNYRLQAGSLAIGAGMALALITNDCDGVLRPSGVAPDVGAYQH